MRSWMVKLQFFSMPSHVWPTFLFSLFQFRFYVEIQQGFHYRASGEPKCILIPKGNCPFPQHTAALCCGFSNCAILCGIQCEPEEHLFLKRVFIKGAIFLWLKILFIYLEIRLSMDIDLTAFPIPPVCLRPASIIKV